MRSAVVALALCACANVTSRVPDVRQSTSYTCGASALQAVFALYGEETREDRLAAELHATPELGVNPDSLAATARAHGFTPHPEEGMTIARLAQLTSHRHPVIVAMQAWPDAPRTRFADDWDDGHYVVVLTVRHGRVRFEDPSLLGSRGELPVGQFVDRWHDSDGKRPYVRYGLWLEGRAPSPPPATRPID